jgi:hypothetical protein
VHKQADACGCPNHLDDEGCNLGVKWIGDCGWDPRTEEHKCGGGGSGFRLFR